MRKHQNNQGMATSDDLSSNENKSMDIDGNGTDYKGVLDKILLIASQNAKSPRRIDENCHSNKRARFRRNRGRRIKSLLFIHRNRSRNNINNGDGGKSTIILEKEKKQQEEQELADIDLPDAQPLNEKDLAKTMAFFRKCKIHTENSKEKKNICGQKRRSFDHNDNIDHNGTSLQDPVPLKKRKLSNGTKSKATTSNTTA